MLPDPVEKYSMLSETYVTAIADKDALSDAELLWSPLFIILVVGCLYSVPLSLADKDALPPAATSSLPHPC